MSDSRKTPPEIEFDLHLHAQLREVAGVGIVPLRLPAGSTVADAFESAIGVHPGLADFRNLVAFACNDCLVTRVATLGGGDRLDVLPPVSGG
jgi:molybdopterin synthase sulfur carrier subunit